MTGKKVLYKMKNQNPFIALAAISGLNVSPQSKSGNTAGVFLRNVEGSPEQINAALKELDEGGYDTTGMISYGSRVDEGGATKVQFICLDVNPGINLVTARANVDKTLVKALLQDDYDYAVMFGTMEIIGGGGGYIRAASWSESFRDQPNAEQVFGLAFNRFFSDDGTVRGTKREDIRTMLLIGNNDERITIVGKPNEDAFKTLPPTGFQTERHAIIGDSLVVCEYDGQQVAGLQAKTVAAWLDTNGEASIDYFFDKLPDGIGAINEIAVVNGETRTTLLTLKDGNIAYLPVGIEIDDDAFKLHVDIGNATSVETVGPGYQPIARLAAIATTDDKKLATKRYALTLVEQNGGRHMLGFTDSSALPPRFTTTARAARDEAFAAAAA